MKSKAKRYKRKPYKPINPEEFRLIRLMNKLTTDDVAKLLQVTSRTVAHWECGSARIPYAAFKLLRMKANGEFLNQAWEGWTIRGDSLYSPTGRAFKPYELTYIANYFTMARYWLADCNQKMAKRQVQQPAKVLRLVTSQPDSERASLLPHMRIKS